MLAYNIYEWMMASTGNKPMTTFTPPSPSPSLPTSATSNTLSIQPPSLHRSNTIMASIVQLT